MNASFFRLPVAAACMLAACGAAQAQTQRQLFLDPASIHDVSHATLHVNPPQRREIVIRPDRPWEQLMISFYLTVLDEGEKLRLWYICRDRDNHPNVAYAESHDGVRWTKPDLGIVEYGGDKQNNLVGLTSLEGSVFRDSRATADQRYVYVTHLSTGMTRFYSPDGLHWKPDRTPLLPFGADTQNVVLWDEHLQSYVLYLRGWLRGDDKQRYRTVVRATLPNLSMPLAAEPTTNSLYMWSKNRAPVITTELPTVLKTDALDPPNSDIYTNSVQLYPLDTRWYVGFPSFFQREKGISDGRLEVQFIGGCNGTTWHRYDRTPYAAPGAAGSESANMAFMGVGMVIHGDEIWQYGTGFRSRHGDVAARKRQTDGVIYRYVQRLDGFVSLDFADEQGRATIETVTVTGPRLLLNVDTGAMGTLRVAMLAADGRAIPGFAAENCRILRTNSTSVEVVWQEDRNVSSLQGRQVALTFVGTRTKLYSFRFE
jgi:hypothetical protein